MRHNNDDFADINDSTVVGAVIIVLTVACVAVLGIVVTLLWIL